MIVFKEQIGHKLSLNRNQDRRSKQDFHISSKQRKRNREREEDIFKKIKKKSSKVLFDFLQEYLFLSSGFLLYSCKLLADQISLVLFHELLFNIRSTYYNM